MAKAMALAKASSGETIHQLINRPAIMPHRIWWPTLRCAKSRTTKTNPTIRSTGDQKSPLASSKRGVIS